MTQPALFALTDGEHSEVAENSGGCALSTHRVGDISEFEFCKQATLRGWRVRHTGGEEQGYDAIISRKGLRSIFVQVKRARWLQRHSNRGYFLADNGGCGKTYSPFAYDILACHLAAIGKWVFYTRNETGNRRGVSYLPPEMRRERHTRKTAMPARDPDNWELLDEVAQSFT